MMRFIRLMLGALLFALLSPAVRQCHGFSVSYPSSRVSARVVSHNDVRSRYSKGPLLPLTVHSKLAEPLFSSNNDNAEFVNDLLAELWENIALAGRSMIISRLEPRFAIFPGSLKTLHFSKVDFGTIPCRVSNVVVHPIENGTVKVDLDVIWEGECEIQLSADIIGSFGIRKVNLQGRMCILLKPLLPVLPTFKAFHFGFINPPNIDLEYTDGLEILPYFSLVDNALRKVLQDYMAEMMVLPIRISYNLFEQDEDIISNDTYSFKESYELPMGIARVSILQGRGFVNKQIGGTIQDVPDVYCKVKLGSSPEWRTTTIQNNLTPEWDNECADFLLSHLGQEITIQACNENIDADDELGSTSVTVEEVMQNETMELELVQDDNPTGAFVSIKYESFPLTTDLSSFQQVGTSSENLLCGLLVVLVTNARDIPVPRKEAATYVKVTVVSSEIRKEFYTGVITDYRYYGADSLNPEYDCAFHAPVTAKMLEDGGGGSVIFELINEDSVMGTTLGTTTFPLTLDTFEAAPDKTITERRSIGDQGATLEFQAILRGVELGDSQPSDEIQPMTEEVDSEDLSVTDVDGSYSTVCITAVKGQGFKQKRRLFWRNKVPDVYCCIQIDSSPDVWRTSTINGNVSPEWYESRHFALLDQDETVSVDVYDAGKKDKKLGSATISVDELLRGMTDVELQKNGEGTGASITLACDKVEAGLPVP